MSPLVPILVILFVAVAGLAFSNFYVLRECRELRIDRDEWQQSFYAEREIARQQCADEQAARKAEIDWLDKLESHANGAGEAS